VDLNNPEIIINRSVSPSTGVIVNRTASMTAGNLMQNYATEEESRIAIKSPKVIMKGNMHNFKFEPTDVTIAKTHFTPF
jgi:hypothetical protein